MTEGGFCPYKQKSEHAHATIISLCMFPYGSVKSRLGYVSLTELKQVPFTDIAWPYSLSNNVKLNLCPQSPRLLTFRHKYVGAKIAYLDLTYWD